MQTNQAQQTNWLVTRNLLTSSGGGSNENVTIKEVRHISQTVQRSKLTYVFLKIVSLPPVWLLPIKLMW